MSSPYMIPQIIFVVWATFAAHPSRKDDAGNYTREQIIKGQDQVISTKQRMNALFEGMLLYLMTGSSLRTME